MSSRRKGKKKKAQFTSGQVRKLKSMAKSLETKIHNTVSTGIFANDGVAVGLANVTEGSGSVQREGVKILAKGLDMRFVIQYQGGSPYESARLIVVKDNAPDFQLPVISDILENNTLKSQYRHLEAGLKRFTILHDQYYHNPSPNRYWNSFTDTEVGVPFQQAYKKTIRLNHNIAYTATTAADDEIGKGAMYMWFISDNTTVSARGATIDYSMRLKYIDL